MSSPPLPPHPSLPPAASPLYTHLHNTALSFFSALVYIPDPPPFPSTSLPPASSSSSSTPIQSPKHMTLSHLSNLTTRDFKHVFGPKHFVSQSPHLQSSPSPLPSTSTTTTTPAASANDKDESKESKGDKHKEGEEEEEASGFSLPSFTSHLSNMTARLSSWDFVITSLFIDETRCSVVARVGFWMVPLRQSSHVSHAQEHGEQGSGDGDEERKLGEKGNGEKEEEGVENEIMWILEMRRSDEGDQEGKEGEGKFKVWRSTEFVDGVAAGALRDMMMSGGN